MQSDSSRVLLAITAALIILLAGGCNPGGDEPERPASESSESGAKARDDQSEVGTTAGLEEPPGRPIDPSRRRNDDLPEGAEAAVPSNFPEDIGVYPGSEPRVGRGGSRDGADFSAVYLMTGDSADEAFQYYSRKLEAEGWNLDSVKENEVGGTVSATKGNRKAVLLIVPAEGGGADIMIVTED